VKFKIDGRELEAPEKLRVGQVCEAERALGVSAEDGFGARTAVMLFVTMRVDEPSKPAHLIADEVMRADIATVEEVGEESPPAGAPVGADHEQDQENPLTSGPLSSANMESLSTSPN
jgi:hypothetical protein